MLPRYLPTVVELHRTKLISFACVARTPEDEKFVVPNPAQVDVLPQVLAISHQDGVILWPNVVETRTGREGVPKIGKKGSDSGVLRCSTLL